MEGPRKTPKDTKRKGCEALITHPAGDTAIFCTPFSFRAFSCLSWTSIPFLDLKQLRLRRAIDAVSADKGLQDGVRTAAVDAQAGDVLGGEIGSVPGILPIGQQRSTAK